MGLTTGFWLSYNHKVGGPTRNGDPWGNFHLYAADCKSSLSGGYYNSTPYEGYMGDFGESGTGTCGEPAYCYPCATGKGYTKVANMTFASGTYAPMNWVQSNQWVDTGFLNVLSTLGLSDSNDTCTH